MPTRILREGIISSTRIIRLSWPAEVFYRRLMSVVDDFGRYHAHPALLRAACYPLQLEKASEADVGKWLTEIREAALVSVYEASGAPYLEMLDFRQQKRATKSKFPAPPPSVKQMLSGGEADVKQLDKQPLSLDEGEDEGEGGAVPRKRGAPKRPLPENFSISPRVMKWAESKGIYNLGAHFESFISKARARGYTYADWDEAFMGAVRADWAGIGDGKRRPAI